MKAEHGQVLTFFLVYPLILFFCLHLEDIMLFIHIVLEKYTSLATTTAIAPTLYVGVGAAKDKIKEISKVATRLKELF